jgi:hypothetical protein
MDTEQVVQAEAKTMGHAVDNAVMAPWIVNFLMNGARAVQG